MKMRFWQKTYIFTLILFLLCLNGGILSLTVYTYGNTVRAVEESATAEQSYIALSFERDYADLTEGKSMVSPYLLMQSYGTHYEKKGLVLGFEKSGERIYTAADNMPKVKPNTLQHMDIGGKRHLVISAAVCNGVYQMLFSKNVESLDREFSGLMLIYGVTAAGVSLLLAVGLFFVLKKLSAPLESLRKTTEAIEGGDFSVVAKEKGNDEFTLLAKSFNAMLKKINEQLATLEEDARKKQMLVDNMAHELRTPLTSIKGYGEYLEKAATSEEEKILGAKYIISEAERLQKISELLLDSAYIRETPSEMAPLNLRDILADTAERLKAKADAAEVSLEVGEKELSLTANPTLLSMLFYNLGENAVKACAEGGRVKLYCTEKGAAVEDNGKGMTAEQLRHITEPFYRTDKSRARAEGGAGLGLALCKQIATLHGGELVFESAVGTGTTAHLVLGASLQVDNTEDKTC